MHNTLLVINGSYKKNGVTTKCLQEVSQSLAKKYSLEITEFFLDDDIMACINCGPNNCAEGCTFTDQFQEIVKVLAEADRVLLGTPVYLDFPSPKLLAFLSRLNSLAESTEREFFRNKKIHLHANGYCSGTKAAISVLFSACEMLGFTIEGRSSTEYVEIWKDSKIRGGMTRADGIWMKNKP